MFGRGSSDGVGSAGGVVVGGGGAGAEFGARFAGGGVVSVPCGGGLVEKPSPAERPTPALWWAQPAIQAARATSWTTRFIGGCPRAVTRHPQRPLARGARPSAASQVQQPPRLL